jgi:hypothetical protein
MIGMAGVFVSFSFLLELALSFLFHAWPQHQRRSGLRIREIDLSLHVLRFCFEQRCILL